MTPYTPPDSEEVQELRIKLNWTHKRMAQELNVSPAQVARYLNGQTPMRKSDWLVMQASYYSRYNKP